VSNHKFKIGQSVNYKSGQIGAARSSGVYKITQLLPPEGDDFQCKIKSAAEPHERVVKEASSIAPHSLGGHDDDVRLRRMSRTIHPKT
jgi:hypothetical protein